MKFHDETAQEKKLRLALEGRRREVEELIPRLEHMKKYVRENPKMNPQILEKIQKTIKASEKFLSDDARERNLDDKN